MASSSDEDWQPVLCFPTHVEKKCNYVKWTHKFVSKQFARQFVSQTGEFLSISIVINNMEQMASGLLNLKPGQRVFVDVDKCSLYSDN